MDAKTFLDAYTVNRLYDREVPVDKAGYLVSKRFLKLSYSTGTMEVSQVIMLDQDNNFYGIDALGRLVAGAFVDERYIVFYIMNNDKSVTKFIGYNSVSHITLQFVDSKVLTEMKIEVLPTIHEDLLIESTYDKIMEKINYQDPNELIKFLRELKQYQEYVEGIRSIKIELGLENEVPIIKELKQ